MIQSPMEHITTDIETRLSRVEALLLDVDGVLTDGGIIFNDTGSEIKVFNVRDGLGLRLLMGQGIKVGIVTGRSSKVLDHRCENLGIEHIFDDIRDKGAILPVISKQIGAPPEKMAFVGDDLIDLPLMLKVGVSVAVADACETVKKCAHVITRASGGQGAVREVCETILNAKGLWKKIEKKYGYETLE